MSRIDVERDGGSWRDRLARALGDAVVLDAPLAPRVAFRIGGPADALVRPRSSAALALTLAIAREEGVPVTVLGTGSNVLVSDLGIRGITLRLSGELADVHLAREGDGGRIDAGAGALNATMVALALQLGLVAIEFLGTIPGTLGGALIMNAGAHGGELAPFVREVTLVNRENEVETRTAAQCGFSYRASAFLPGEVLTQAVLELPRGDVAAARERLLEMRQRRRSTQPLHLPNAGSIFKNPPGDYAGRLIELCGLKGLTQGGAQISPLHGNFIVNLGGASAADVVALAETATARVRRESGVELEWEVKRLGDWMSE